MTLQAGTNPQARWALALGIASVVLIYPFGVIFGPVALWFGLSVVRGIGRSGTVTGARQARTGMILGGIVTGLYLVWLLAELMAFSLFGTFIPAAP